MIRAKHDTSTYCFEIFSNRRDRTHKNNKKISKIAEICSLFQKILINAPASKIRV